MQKRLPWLLISKRVVSLSPLIRKRRSLSSVISTVYCGFSIAAIAQVAALAMPCSVVVGVALLIEMALEACASALEKTKGTVAQAVINTEINRRVIMGTPLGKFWENLGFTLSVCKQCSPPIESFRPVSEVSLLTGMVVLLF